MAFKSTSIEKREILPGKNVEGFLLSHSTVGLSYKGGQVNQVPQVLMQQKDGAKFSVLLGMTVVQDLAQQTVGVWTRITKGAKVIAEEKGKNDYFPYKFEQDADLMVGK